MFYVQFCPLCDHGALGIRICGGCGDALILCDECDALWTAPDLADRPVLPDASESPCPHCGATLNEAPSHWATRDEIDWIGWQDAVLGEGPALGERPEPDA